MGDILTGIVKGLSGFMLQDDPDVKIFNAQTEMKEFSEREGKIYARLGRQVYETDGGENYPEIRAELDLLAAEERARREAEEQEHSCPNCGAYNPEGTNFCQECGTRLTQPVQQAPAAKRFCPNCGTEVIAGHRFCSGCGTKME